MSFVDSGYYLYFSSRVLCVIIMLEMNMYDLCLNNWAHSFFESASLLRDQRTFNQLLLSVNVSDFVIGSVSSRAVDEQDLERIVDVFHRYSNTASNLME